MPTPAETVTAFLMCWNEGVDRIYSSLHEYLAPDGVWENVGLSRTVGPAEAEAVFKSFEPMKTCKRMPVELLAIASVGNKVLTERVDTVIDSSEQVSAVVRCMGTFEVSDGKITAWRDYFDTVPFAR